MVTWGALAISAGTGAAALGAAVMIIGICLSRLYLGVHDIEDVAGGLPRGSSAYCSSRATGRRSPNGGQASLASSGGPAPRSSGFAPTGLPEPDGPGAVLGLSAHLRMVARAPARA